MRRRVLISWIAVDNDPYERDRAGNAFRLVDCSPVPGPTLTLLFDPDSPYAGSISDVVLFYGRSPAGKETRQSRAVSQTLEELKVKDPALRIHQEHWDGDDPTDHGQIFEFLRERLPAVRRRSADRELIIHVSPGTPSMQTVLVLMGETGFIDAPFSLVKSYRKEERTAVPLSFQFGSASTGAMSNLSSTDVLHALVCSWTRRAHLAVPASQLTLASAGSSRPCSEPAVADSGLD